MSCGALERHLAGTINHFFGCLDSRSWGGRYEAARAETHHRRYDRYEGGSREKDLALWPVELAPLLSKQSDAPRGQERRADA